MPMSDVLLMFMPNELIPLVVVGIGVALIVGLVNRKRAIGLVVLLLCLPLLDQVLGALFQSLPTWVLVGATAFFAIQVVRTVLEFVLGTHAAGHVLGVTVVALARLAGWLLLAPLRFLVASLRLLFRVITARA